MSQPHFSIKPSHRGKTWSRRGILLGGAIAGASSAIGLSTLKTQAVPINDDATILNNALYYEHQAIWAYQFAATKLSDTEVGQAVLALARRNMADHMAHRDLLKQVVESLGVMPAMAESSYDLSAYIQRGEGNLDSDVNIAKLALALETDAAIAYTTEVAKLTDPNFVMAGASIGSNESAHATAIRAAFVSLGIGIDYVPASFVSADTRSQWVLMVDG